MSSNKKITRKDAKAQVKLLSDYYEIDREFMTLEMAERADGHLLALEKHVVKGRLVIQKTSDGKIECVLICKDGKSKAFGVISGEAKVIMDRGESSSHSRIHALMGYLCGDGASAIEELEGNDMSCVESMGMLFMLV